MKRMALLGILLLALFLPACNQGDGRMQDGYYTAEAAEFDVNALY